MWEYFVSQLNVLENTWKHTGLSRNRNGTQRSIAIATRTITVAILERYLRCMKEWVLCFAMFTDTGPFTERERRTLLLCRLERVTPRCHVGGQCPRRPYPIIPVMPTEDVTLLVLADTSFRC